MTTLESNDSEVNLLVPVDESLLYYLKGISPILNQDGVTEVCINQPGELWYEKDNAWHRHYNDFYSQSNLDLLFNHIADTTRQNISDAHPVLSASLETGERVQLVKPPSAKFHSLTIRKPSTLELTLEDLDRYGAFDHVERVITTEPEDKDKAHLTNDELELINLLTQGSYKDFFRKAVKSHKNIIVSGATGSGKTTFTKSLIREIAQDERIITIEDVPELTIPQPNHVRLIYSKDARSTTKTTPKMLLESCLRMRPDRILLAELRGEEAFYYVRNVNSGHPGSITSIHASNTRQAFDQLMLYIKESDAGSNLAREDIINLLRILIDVVVQYKRLPNGTRAVTEIFYDPVSSNNLAEDMNQ